MIALLLSRVRLVIAAIIAAAILAAGLWVFMQIRAGHAAAIERDRLSAELARANEALAAERDLLNRRTADLNAQIRLFEREAVRRAQAQRDAETFESRIHDFGPPVEVPPLIERTLREVFP